MVSEIMGVVDSVGEITAEKVFVKGGVDDAN